jgi:hypothetical protein
MIGERLFACQVGNYPLEGRESKSLRPTRSLVFGLDKANARQVAARRALLPTRSDRCPPLTAGTLSAPPLPNRLATSWSSSASSRTTRRACSTSASGSLLTANTLSAIAARRTGLSSGTTRPRSGRAGSARPAGIASIHWSERSSSGRLLGRIDRSARVPQQVQLSRRRADQATEQALRHGQ